MPTSVRAGSNAIHQKKLNLADPLVCGTIISASSGSLDERFSNEANDNDQGAVVTDSWN